MSTLDMNNSSVTTESLFCFQYTKHIIACQATNIHNEPGAIMIHRNLILLFLMTISSTMLFANERLFSYTYQSNVLGKGQREIEIWNTFHWQRDDFYRSFRHRIEYEVGLVGKLQTAFYLNLTNTTSLQGNGAAAFLENETEFGFSNEWKFQMSDPVADAFGSALYAEIGLASNEFELEGKLILDKQAGNTLHAFNAVIEPEWKTIVENGKTATEFELKWEFDYGFSCALNENWKLGIELRNDNEYTKAEGWVYSALFGGPVISYSTEGFWITATVLPQLYAFRTEPGNKSKHRELIAHEQLETRLLFSYEL